MKKLSIVICILICLQTITKAQETTTTPVIANPNGAKIKFEKEVIDYGTIEWNTDPDKKFKFTNVGKEPLIIWNAVGSCGCLSLRWPKEPILPGKTGEIIAHYDTKRVGQFEKNFTVTSNSNEMWSFVLKIKGVVKPDSTPADATSIYPAEQKH